MSAIELAALLIFVPTLVFFVYRSGFGTGAERMLRALHSQGFLTQACIREFDLNEELNEE